jgi:hypothetical protein
MSKSDQLQLLRWVYMMLSLQFKHTHCKHSCAIPAVIGDPNSPTARKWHCGIYEYASSSDGNPHTIRLPHRLVDCSNRRCAGDSAEWVLLLLPGADRRQLHKCCSDVRMLYTAVKQAHFYFYPRYGLSDQDFVTWNNNPSLPCPSLTTGSFVCLDVLNITDTAPPTPTNAAPGSGSSVLVLLLNLCCCHSLGTWITM